MTNQLSVGVALFFAIVLFNQWRRGTLGQWLRAKVLGVAPVPDLPPNATGQGGSFTGPATNPASRAGGGGGGGAW